MVYEHPQNSTGHFAHGRGTIACIWNAFQKGRRLRGGAQQCVSQFSGAHPHGTVSPCLFCSLAIRRVICHLFLPCAILPQTQNRQRTTKHTLKPSKLSQNKPCTSQVHNLRVCCPGKSWHRGSLLYTITQSPLFPPKVPHR